MFASTNTSSECIKIHIYNKLFDPKICVPKIFPKKIQFGHQFINIDVSFIDDNENLLNSSPNSVSIFLYNKNNSSTLIAAQLIHKQINYVKSIFIGVDDKSKKILKVLRLSSISMIKSILQLI